MRVAIPIAAVVIGFVLLGLSFVWTSLAGAETTWTEEKSQRSVDVKARLAYLGGQINSTKLSMHGGPDKASLKAEFDTLQKENEELNEAFRSVSDRPNAIAKILRWTGICLSALGLVGWYAVKQTS